jgi:curved DNA-binding protein CbpA
MDHTVRNAKEGTDRREEDRPPEPTQVAKRARDTSGKKPAFSTDDPHDILGVRRRASVGEIRSAYLRLVKELHPDGRAPDLDAHEADERLKAITEAYKKLKGAGRAGAREVDGQAWRGRAITVFVAGALASAVPVFVTLGAFYYYTVWLGPRDPAPDTGPNAETASAFTKDPSVGRQSAFADARKAGTKAAWTRFLEAYPEGEPAAEARQAIAAIDRAEALKRESIAWAEAKKGTKEALQRFVDAFPDGEHAPKARQAIAAIELALARKLQERTAWGAASKGSKEAIEGFISAFPDGEHALQAKRALAAIAAAEEAQRQADLAAWTIADRAGGKEALNKYLSDFPSGRHAEEAKLRVARLDIEEGEKDDAAWLKARQRNSQVAYAGYLTSHPLGRHAADARTRIAKLVQIEAMAKQAKAQAAKETRFAESVKPAPAPAPKAGAGMHAWPTADEPFAGPDGRIRR